MKQLFLCGAISVNLNYIKDFETAHKKLKEAGYKVLNPLEFCKELRTREDCMQRCLSILITNRELGIAKIETPYQSEGADLETQVGEALGYEIKSVDEWVRYGTNKVI